eukprot:6182722-Pleurochrysis_carterae.AAC.6
MAKSSQPAWARVAYPQKQGTASGEYAHSCVQPRSNERGHTTRRSKSASTCTVALLEHPRHGCLSILPRFYTCAKSCPLVSKAHTCLFPKGCRESHGQCGWGSPAGEEPGSISNPSRAAQFKYMVSTSSNSMHGTSFGRSTLLRKEQRREQRAWGHKVHASTANVQRIAWMCAFHGARSTCVSEMRSLDCGRLYLQHRLLPRAAAFSLKSAGEDLLQRFQPTA